jgi:adhesin/invasin
MRLLRLLAVGLAGTALVSCGGDDLVLPGEGEPATIAIVQGNGASGRVGEALSEPLVVEVRDGVDRPVAGATVVIDLAGALVEPDTISTDAAGTASAEITLGAEVGEVAGAARVVAPESPAEVRASFTVVGLAASANGLAGVSGDGQTGPAGTQLPEPLVVEVTDAFGNPVEGVPITWTPDVGSVSETATTTDGSGRTSVTRTLGPTAGTQTTTASSGELAGSPVVFSHTVTAGSASGVLIVAGNEQRAPPGTTLPEDLVVQVVDQDGNAVVGAAVTWVVTAGGGTLSPTTGTTDADGRAATTWTLGASVGTNTAQAIVSGVGQAEFTATAAAGSASELRIISGNDQTGQAGAPLANALVVQVLDEGDNPVGGATVTWTIASGGGSVSPGSATTDAGGQASTGWTLGPRPGTQRVRASSPGAGFVRFEATSTAGAPAVLGLATQPSAQAQVGVPFGRQPVVQVRDAAGNPVPAPGVTVTAAIATGGGQLIGTATRTTGTNGRAAFTNLAIGGATGAHSLIFAAPGINSVTSSGIEVNPVGTTTRLTSDSPDPSAPGQGVEVVFEVTSPGGTPSGTVQVTASGGSESCSAPVSTGRCTIVLTAEGDRTLTAAFQGSELFNPSSASTPHSVFTPDTPPTAVDDGYSATGGVQLSEPAPGVLANDVDVDGDPLSARLIDGTDHGTLTLRSDGSFDYLPDAGFFGSDSFTYEVSAGGATDTGEVTIIVN